jgi:hypothetical protein
MPPKSEQPPIELNAPASLPVSLVCDELIEQRAGKIGEVEAAPRVEYTDPDGETRSYPVWTDYIASSAGENRNDDWMETGQMVLKHYRANPVVMALHDRRSWPVGTGQPRLVGKQDDAVLYMRVHWDLEDWDVRKIVGKVDRKVLRTGSIGAMLGKGSDYRWRLDPSHKAYKEKSWGRYVAHPVLEEFSIVPIPGDRTARAVSQSANNSTPPASPPASTTNEGPSMDFKALLLSVLALSADASDEQIQAAADNHTPTDRDALASAVCNALGVDDLPEDFAVQLSAATDRTGFLPLSEVNEMVKAAAQTTDPKVEARAAVEAAVQSGAITPALKSHYLKLADADPVACAAAVGGLKPSSAVPLKPQDKPTNTAGPSAPVTLSDLDRETIQMMGLTEAEFLAQKEA